MAEEQVAGVRLVNRSYSSGEEVIDEFSWAGWDIAGKGMGRNTLEAAINAWRASHPGIELRAAVDRDGNFYLFHKKGTFHATVQENTGAGIFREFADYFGKYGQKWTEDFRKDQGRGWSELPVKPRTASEYNRVFVDFARKGYEVYSELRAGFYFIYVKKVTGAERVAWQDAVRNMHRRNYNWKYVVETVLKQFPGIAGKDVVDHIITEYLGRDKLRKAIYKPERRIVYVAPVLGYIMAAPGVHQYYLVEGTGLRGFRDMSFDPVEISKLERGLRPFKAVDEVKIREILRNYKTGLIDTSEALKFIKEVVGGI